MMQVNQVQFIGKVTLEPRSKNISEKIKLAELGVGIPDSRRKANGEWESKMHFVDVVLWDKQAEYALQHLKKGDGVMVLGALQYESWEKEGKKQSKLRVKGQKIVQVVLPEVQAKAV